MNGLWFRDYFSKTAVWTFVGYVSQVVRLILICLVYFCCVNTLYAGGWHDLSVKLFTI